MQIVTDFVDDVRVGDGAKLQQLGYDLPERSGDSYADAHRIEVALWNALARRIPAQPREVHWSAELRAREPGLNAATRSGLAIVDQELRDGIDLTARLSRNLLRRDYRDPMLNDWGIHHLHLGDVIEHDGFMSRTGDVLIAMIRPERAFLVDVRFHGKGVRPWADSDLIDIIHANWPAEIARHRYNVVKLMHVVTDEQRLLELRPNGINSAVQLKDGTVYGALGGGRTTVGTNPRAVLWADQRLANAKMLEGHVAEHHEWVKNLIEEETGSSPPQVRCRLGVLERDHAIIVVEHPSGRFGFRVPLAEPPHTVVDLTQPATI